MLLAKFANGPTKSLNPAQNSDAFELLTDSRAIVQVASLRAKCTTILGMILPAFEPVALPGCRLTYGAWERPFAMGESACHPQRDFGKG